MQSSQKESEQTCAAIYEHEEDDGKWSDEEEESSSKQNDDWIGEDPCNPVHSPPKSSLIFGAPQIISTIWFVKMKKR
jgi:hypothetical protein